MVKIKKGTKMESMLILHDLPSDKTENLLRGSNDGRYTVFAADPPVRPCVGCFGCWIKTPGRCVIDDRGQGFAGLISRHDVFMIVSRSVYGGFSPPVKAVLDRSIGHMLPFFRVTNGEMHHAPRHAGQFALECVFYGPDISEEEMAVAERLVAANAVNLSASDFKLRFFPSVDALEGIL
jgi:hypothetical protein